MSAENLIINVEHLSKSFKGVPAVIDVSLKVKRGEIFGFLGPNGSGKTTTLRMLCGLLTPDSGSGTCMDYNIITETKKIKEHIGYIPQFFSLYKQLTIYENLLLVAELYGVTDRKRKIKSMMEQFNLSSRANQISGSLSGGWKQRVALAAALVHDPLLLLLDEPTASVDPDSRREFWEIMYNLSTQGMTMLLCSHNMDDIEHCDDIAYICDGKLLLSGKIKEIIKTLHLKTWKVKGKNLNLLLKQLHSTPNVEQVITFFDVLHVSGQNHQALDQALSVYMSNPSFTWEVTETTLEDAFIWLSKHHRDKHINFKE